MKYRIQLGMINFQNIDHPGWSDGSNFPPEVGTLFLRYCQTFLPCLETEPPNTLVSTSNTDYMTNSSPFFDETVSSMASCSLLVVQYSSNPKDLSSLYVLESILSYHLCVCFLVNDIPRGRA